MTNYMKLKEGNPEHLFRLSLEQGELDNNRKKGIAGVSERFLSSALMLAEEEFLGWQISAEERKRIAGYGGFAFSSSGVKVTAEDFSWIFKSCGRVSEDDFSERKDFYEEGRVVYMLSSVQGTSNDIAGTVIGRESKMSDDHSSDSSEGSNFSADLFRQLMDADAVIRIAAISSVPSGSGHGMILISLPEEMSLRMRAVISLAFPHLAAKKIDEFTEKKIEEALIPDEFLMDAMTKLLCVLFDKTREDFFGDQNGPEDDAEDMLWDEFDDLEEDLDNFSEDDIDILINGIYDMEDESGQKDGTSFEPSDEPDQEGSVSSKSSDESIQDDRSSSESANDSEPANRSAGSADESGRDDRPSTESDDLDAADRSTESAVKSDQDDCAFSESGEDSDPANCSAGAADESDQDDHTSSLPGGPSGLPKGRFTVVDQFAKGDSSCFTPIEDLNFSIRTFVALKRAEIHSVEKLRTLTDDEFMCIRNFSKKCMDEVKQKIAEYYETSETEAPVKVVNAVKKLDALIGLEGVKTQIRKVAAFARMKQDIDRYGKPDLPVSLHMEFVGNPGTAKTTVARIAADIFCEIGLLPCGEIVEVGQADLVAEYVGNTAPKVKELFKKARGKVLFIDEAYSLAQAGGRFAEEAINTLVQEMENNRDSTIVIFAGYPEEMKHFFSKNPGLRSRVSFRINFEDYTAEELLQITKMEAEKRGFSIDPEAEDKVLSICESADGKKDGGNGRFSRNLIEHAIIEYAMRVYGADLFETEESGGTSVESEICSTFTLTEADFNVAGMPAAEKGCDGVSAHRSGKNPIGFRAA